MCSKPSPGVFWIGFSDFFEPILEPYFVSYKFFASDLFLNEKMIIEVPLHLVHGKEWKRIIVAVN